MSDFEEWYDENLQELLKGNLHDALAEAWQAAQAAERERTKELVYVLKEAVDCGLVPKTPASEGGASKYARRVIAAYTIRAAIAKYEEINEPT